MVKISVDTDRDSPETIRKIIQLLEQFANQPGFAPQQGSVPVPPAPAPTYNHPVSQPVSAPSSVPTQTDMFAPQTQTPAANPFDMFNSSPEPSTPEYSNPFDIPNSAPVAPTTEMQSEPAAPSGGMFDVFASTPPSTEPNIYGDAPSTSESVIFNFDDDLSSLDVQGEAKKEESDSENIRVMEYE